MQTCKNTILPMRLLIGRIPLFALECGVCVCWVVHGTVKLYRAEGLVDLCINLWEIHMFGIYKFIFSDILQFLSEQQSVYV